MVQNCVFSLNQHTNQMLYISIRVIIEYFVTQANCPEKKMQNTVNGL